MSSWAEDMNRIMREQSAIASGGSGLQLAVMTGATSLKIGSMELLAEDLLFAEHLIRPPCTQVAGTCPSGGGALSDSSTYLTALTAGDQVLVYRLNDTTYIVLERVVKAS